MMSFRLRQIAVVCLLMLGRGILLPAVAQEAANPAPPFLVRSWQTDQGLPNNTVNAITQTRDGYLWLGTDNGLVRFDGVHCRVLGLPEGLSSLQISALLEDHLGALWVGTTGGGLNRLFHGEIENFTIKDGLAGNSIQTVLEATNGDIWVATSTGLCRRSNGKFEVMGHNLGLVYDLARDRQGDVCAATLHNGLVCFRDDRFSTNNRPAGIGDFNPRCLLVDRQDRLWVGAREKCIYCYANGSWTRYGTNEGFPEIVLNRLAESADGAVWAASLNEGVYFLQNGRFNALRMKDGLPDDAILSLFADSQFLWAGSQSGGLSRIGPKRLTVWHALEGSSECQLRSLTETTNGDLWVGTYGQGIYRQPAGQLEMAQVTEKPFHDHVIVEAMLGTADGSLWWGAGPVLYQWRAGQQQFKFGEGVLAGDRIWCLCEAPDDGMWVGTYNGQLLLVSQGKATALKGLSGRPITSLAWSEDGTLWIGSLGGGLGRWQHGQLTTLTTRDGLRSNLIRTLRLDSDGTLWIGMDGGGLARWSHDHLVSFTSQEGLIDDTVLQILDDDNGSLWLGCNRGIYRVYKRVLNDVAGSQAASVHTLVFGRSDGMPSEACVGNFGAALKTHDGQLCFSTAKGIVVIDPRHQVNNATPPTVLMEDVLMDGRGLTNLPAGKPASPLATLASAIDFPGGAGLQIPPGRHSFEFHYTALSFDAPEKIQFKYQLNGLDSHWIEAGNIRVAHYGYVPPGSYRFRVLASNGNGQWNETGADVSFTVLPYFWQMAWFELLLALAILGLFAGGIRYVERRRYRARLKRLERERAMTTERERIACDLHDELGSSLNYISMSVSDLGRSRGDDAEELKSRLEKVSTFAVRTARSLDEIVWAVNPQNDSLRSLVEYLTQLARELFEDTGIRCRFQIQEDLPALPLPPEMRHHLFLTVKEALNNTLKHARATEIVLGAATAGRQVELFIHDNGAGFDAAAAAGSERNGLKNMRRRIETLGGRLMVETKPGDGTTIRLTVSYPTGYKPESPAGAK